MSKTEMLKYAKALVILRAAEKQVKEMQIKMRGKNGGSYTFGGNDDRQDITFSIPLADYLAQFADKTPMPVFHSYIWDTEIDGVKVAGTREYVSYPAQYAGTVKTTKPPTHVWIEASSPIVWAKGDPKPVAPIVPAIAETSTIEPVTT